MDRRRQPTVFLCVYQEDVRIATGCHTPIAVRLLGVSEARSELYLGLSVGRGWRGACRLSVPGRGEPEQSGEEEQAPQDGRQSAWSGSTMVQAPASDERG